MVVRQTIESNIVNNFYFIKCKIKNTDLYLYANYVDTIQTIKVKIQFFEYKPDIEVHEGRIIVPYNNDFYVINVYFCGKKSSYRHCHDENIFFEKEYMNFVPPHIYIVICGMIATKI